MPPSGFTKSVVDMTRQALGKCFDDLRQEAAEGKHESVEEGLKYEIEQIDKALGHRADEGQPFQLEATFGMLQLVRAFYVDLLKGFENGSVDEATTLGKLGEELDSVHIDPEGKLVKRIPVDITCG